MVKIYNIWIGDYCGDEHTDDYIEYYRNDTHLYLVALLEQEDLHESRFLRIKITDRNKKIIYDFEPFWQAYRVNDIYDKNEWEEKNEL